MWSHITGIELKVDFEALIAKDALFLTKDGVGELGIEGLKLLEARVARLYQ